MVKRTPLVGKKLRNEKKICLLFHSVFLNFSNEESLYLLIQIVYEIIRITFGCQNKFLMRLWLQDLGLNENPCSVMQRGLCSTAIKMDGKRRAHSEVTFQALICQEEILLGFLWVSLSSCRDPSPLHRIRPQVFWWLVKLSLKMQFLFDEK